LDSGQVKVLIIEDYPDMRALLCLILKSLGYLPIVASHGKEGVEKAISEKPKLILMDIGMPIMDGLEAARALRAHHETRDIPILVTTALLRHPDRAACLEAGCSDFMVRPFNVLDLQNKIRELLSGQ
jgi:CheY-like chemotaxis protein